MLLKTKMIIRASWSWLATMQYCCLVLFGFVLFFSSALGQKLGLKTTLDIGFTGVAYADHPITNCESGCDGGGCYQDRDKDGEADCVPGCTTDKGCNDGGDGGTCGDGCGDGDGDGGCNVGGG